MEIIGKKISNPPSKKLTYICGAGGGGDTAAAILLAARKKKHNSKHHVEVLASGNSINAYKRYMYKLYLSNNAPRKLGINGREGLNENNMDEYLKIVIKKPQKDSVMFSINIGKNNFENRLKQTKDMIEKLKIKQDGQKVLGRAYNTLFTEFIIANVYEIPTHMIYTIGGFGEKYFDLDGNPFIANTNEEKYAKYVEEMKKIYIGLIKKFNSIFKDYDEIKLEVIDFGGDIVKNLNKDVLKYGRDENFLFMLLLLEKYYKNKFKVEIVIYGVGVDGHDEPTVILNRLTSLQFEENQNKNLHKNIRNISKILTEFKGNSNIKTILNDTYKSLFGENRATQIFLRSHNIVNNSNSSKNAIKNVQRGLIKRGKTNTGFSVYRKNFFSKAASGEPRELIAQRLNNKAIKNNAPNMEKIGLMKSIYKKNKINIKKNNLGKLITNVTSQKKSGLI